MTRYAALTGWGMAVPDRLLTNADLEQMIDTSREWIETRTGIRTRHIAAPGETTSSLATAAGRQALAAANVQPYEIDLVVLATCTPDRPFPATACTVQANLGLWRAGAFDLGAACSGFVYGLSVATSMIRAGAARRILFVAADVFTHYINWADRETCILFGDGAGAVVLEASEQEAGLISHVLGAAGDQEALMFVEAGGTRLPTSAEALARGQQYVTMKGRDIFKHAVRAMEESSREALALAHMTAQDLALVVPHQANIRIIEAVARRLELPMQRVFTNLDQYGNTSAASIPIAICCAAAAGRLNAGDAVLLTAFGGGLTWASAVVRW